jgi:CBS domain-containing protein
MSKMRLLEILNAKGHDVFSTTPETTVQDVVNHLVEHNCGSLVVLEGEKLVGIVTERDVLRACAKDPTGFLSASVAECMTAELQTGTPQDKVDDVMGVMTRQRIRHLPVLDESALVGVISIGDLVKAQHDQLSVENHHLKSYIHG